MANTQQKSSWLFYAEDYGRQTKRSIHLAQTRGMWADITFAYDFARKAFHFGAKELDRLDDAISINITLDNSR